MTAERNSPHPLQNRVDPFGDVYAAPERGTLMGNRGGRLHCDDRTLGGGRWTSRRWIVCLCAFKGRRREVWGAGYTELFFFDEPTALAAGHRPCFECRREAARAFLAAFPGAPKGADAMDTVLHAERLEGRRKRLWRMAPNALPDGAMVARNGRAFALRGGIASPWSFAGYGPPEPFPPGEDVDVLTPPSTVAALAAGYRPIWSRSA
jgi:hypothetical protein